MQLVSGVSEFMCSTCARFFQLILNIWEYEQLNRNNSADVWQSKTRVTVSKCQTSLTFFHNYFFIAFWESVSVLYFYKGEFIRRVTEVLIHSSASDFMSYHHLWHLIYVFCIITLCCDFILYLILWFRRAGRLAGLLHFWIEQILDIIKHLNVPSFVKFFTISNSCHGIFELLFWKENVCGAAVAVEAMHVAIWWGEEVITG